MKFGDMGFVNEVIGDFEGDLDVWLGGENAELRRGRDFVIGHVDGDWPASDFELGLVHRLNRHRHGDRFGDAVDGQVAAGGGAGWLNLPLGLDAGVALIPR